MGNQVEDQPVLNHIQRLVAEEHRLHEQRARSKADRKRLEQVQVELDQCWDLLRQRRAFVRSALTQTTRKFARHRLLEIMTSRDRDEVSTNQTSSTDMLYEMSFGAGLFSEIQKERIYEDHG